MRPHRPPERLSEVGIGVAANLVRQVSEAARLLALASSEEKVLRKRLGPSDLAILDLLLDQVAPVAAAVCTLRKHLLAVAARPAQLD